MVVKLRLLFLFYLRSYQQDSGTKVLYVTDLKWMDLDGWDSKTLFQCGWILDGFTHPLAIH